MFDAAVILRTLYAGLGVTGWKLTLIGLGRRIPMRLVIESRTPVEVMARNVSTEPVEPERPIYIVDPRGEPAWRLRPPKTLVIDYGGSYASALSNAIRVRSLGLNMYTYEAIGVIYEYWIRPLAAKKVADLEPYSRDIRSGVYLAKKVLEAINTFDNYAVLEPSVIIYTLRKIYLERRIILDPSTTHISISHIDGDVKEEIIAEMYNARTYKRIGELHITYRGGVLEVLDDKGLAYRIVVDVPRRRVCSAPGLCISLNNENSRALEAFRELRL